MGFGIAIFLLTIGGMLGREESHAEEFEKWLLDHKAALFEGQPLNYLGQNIDKVRFGLVLRRAPEKSRQ